MFRQRPLLGWGLGTFETVYPQFRSFYTNLLVDKAHNDYSQLLAETGIVGFALMVWFLVSVFRRALPKIRNWPSDVNGAVTLAAIIGIAESWSTASSISISKFPPTPCCSFPCAQSPPWPPVSAIPAATTKKTKRPPIPTKCSFDSLDLKNG